MEDNRFKYSNFREVFGELQTVYRVKRGCTEKFLIPATLFSMIPFGVITYIASEDKLTIPCCIVIPVLMFSLAAWHLFTTRKDELRIYENGFTHQSGRKLQSCLWTEIETYKHRERNDRELAESQAGAAPLGAIEKKNGETIDFDLDLPGTPEIVARFEKSKWKGLAQ